jgi:hypothetical protein
MRDHAFSRRSSLKATSVSIEYTNIQSLRE